MPLQKILFKPGVNRENTRYTTEGGWYECDKVRFRQGNPEVIGGWQRFSTNTFLGVCRSLRNWVTTGALNLIGLGTNLKFYIAKGGEYFDITPIRATSTINNNPFATTDGLTLVTVTDTAHGGATDDFVTFSGASTVGGLNLNNEYQMTVLTANTYTITAATAATSTATGGGASVVAAYQIGAGSEVQQALNGWGAGGWGDSPWGFGISIPGINALRIWSQANFGDSLIFGHRQGAIYYWDASLGTGTRGVLVSSLPGADADVPIIQNYLFVSDVSRFTFAFGCNDYGSFTQDPMLIRWSDQESLVDWTPSITNQAGSVRLSHGSEIVAVVQTRQEIVVFTDSAVYSLQYLGPPFVWSTQLLGDNISIYSQNAAVLASGVVYWMGVDKFYAYDGRVQTLNCDLRRYVFEDINFSQNLQVFAGTNEGFNEVWWFYCSANSENVDRYVVYNYIEKIWYYGTMARTAWLDSGLLDYPIAATYDSTLVSHEFGLNDVATETPLPINAYIASSEFDIGDGHNFAFVWRVLPDLTFGNSQLSQTGASPQVTMTLQGLTNSGSGVTTEVGKPVVEGSTYTITEEFTGQIYTRFRGRQMIFKIASNQLNTTWQLGAPRIDIRPDGRR
jgi:hypothetical protein